MDAITVRLPLPYPAHKNLFIVVSNEIDGLFEIGLVEFLL